MGNQLAIDIERRRRHVASALGSLRIEGLEVSIEARAIFDRYIMGDIRADEVTAAILARTANLASRRQRDKKHVGDPRREPIRRLAIDAD